MGFQGPEKEDSEKERGRGTVGRGNVYFTKRPELGIVADGDDDEAVFRLKTVVRDDVGVGISDSLRNLKKP